MNFCRVFHHHCNSKVLAECLVVVFSSLVLSGKVFKIYLQIFLQLKRCVFCHILICLGFPLFHLLCVLLLKLFRHWFSILSASIILPLIIFTHFPFVPLNFVLQNNTIFSQDIILCSLLTPFCNLSTAIEILVVFYHSISLSDLCWKWLILHQHVAS